MRKQEKEWMVRFYHNGDCQRSFTEICPGTCAIQNIHKQAGKWAEQLDDSFL